MSVQVKEPKSKILDPFDIAKAINTKKLEPADIKDFATGGPESERLSTKYNAYMVNLCLSMSADTIHYANIMNLNSQLNPRMQFTFLYHAIPKRTRYTEWQKLNNHDDLEIVKQVYDYSNEKARTALYLLTPEQIQNLRERVDVGGYKNKAKKNDRSNTETQ